MANNCFFKCFFLFLVTSQCLYYDVVEALDDAVVLASIAKLDEEGNNEIIYQKLHHIVKRDPKRGKSKSKSKSKQSSKNRDPYPKQSSSSSDPYPKQPAHNPSYNPSAPGNLPSTGVSPPAYPGTNSRPSYPSGPPPPYSPPNSKPSYPSYPSAPPAYSGYPPQTGYGGGFGLPPKGKGYNMGGNYGSRKSGAGLGSTIGAAGFGALAGTAIGAYGGYQMGKMVGSLGTAGHFGYYTDYGKYIRCDPPKSIKIDPETNVTYIPFGENYDKRCSYFDRQPPTYFTIGNSAGNDDNSINLINFSLLESFHIVFDILAVLVF